jgi:hypothetical protein
MSILTNIIEQIDLIKKNLVNLQNSPPELENKKIYLLMCYRELSRDLSDMLKTTDELVLLNNDTSSSLEEFNKKIENKETEIMGTADFMKTFTPIMVLYNMGFLNRNWN